MSGVTRPGVLGKSGGAAKQTTPRSKRRLGQGAPPASDDEELDGEADDAGMGGADAFAAMRDSMVAELQQSLGSSVAASVGTGFTRLEKQFTAMFEAHATGVGQ